MPDLARDQKAAARIITRAICIISDHWTNKGYKIKQPDKSYKMCIFACLDQATHDLYGESHSHNHLAAHMVNHTAMRIFGMSGVSVNDELGLPSSIKLLAITLEEVLTNAFRAPTYYR